ncbi:hypothetical protein L810_5703 [Burkholderia sp. AU4i]|nr:hypothetical protein L810_5703 [Burkholderia sp. AU4i]
MPSQATGVLRRNVDDVLRPSWLAYKLQSVFACAAEASVPVLFKWDVDNGILT